MTREQWLAKRMGNLTGSKISALFTEPKSIKDKEAGNLSETTKYYLDEKICELLTGYQEEGFTTKEMQWGIDNEPYAANLLKEQYKDLEYFGGENPKFFQYSDFSGGSPDAVCGNIVFEIKCPNPRTHIEYMLEKELKSMNSDYYYQLQMNMACVAKERGINVMDMRGMFVSYCPLMIEHKLRLFKLEIEPDAALQELLPYTIKSAELYLRNIIDKFEL